jgi:elongation factor P
MNKPICASLALAMQTSRRQATTAPLDELDPRLSDRNLRRAPSGAAALAMQWRRTGVGFAATLIKWPVQGGWYRVVCPLWDGSEKSPPSSASLNAALFREGFATAMMIKATDIRRGMVITIDGTNFVVVDFAHHTPGNLRAMVQTKLRNMSSGALIDKRLRSVDQVEVPFVETKEYEYLYSSGDEHVFMDTETYDQLSFSPEILGTAMQFLLPNSKVTVKYVDEKPVSIEVPASIDLVVTETPPSIKGATATNQYKEAVLETGLKVQVPPFIGPGEKIRIDTRTGEYVERVK